MDWLFPSTVATLIGTLALAASFLSIWGIHKLDYPFLRPLENLAPWGYLLGARPRGVRGGGNSDALFS